MGLHDILKNKSTILHSTKESNVQRSEQRKQQADIVRRSTVVLFVLTWDGREHSAYLEERLGPPLFRLLLNPALLVDTTSPLSRVDLGRLRGRALLEPEPWRDLDPRFDECGGCPATMQCENNEARIHN